MSCRIYELTDCVRKMRSLPSVSRPPGQCLETITQVQELLDRDLLLPDRGRQLTHNR